MSAVAPLPSVENARLPQTYANAKTALYNCVSIDECQSWADKAAALASYAKQAGDDSLMKMATRIRDRAIRRSGELLKQIEPAKNQHDASARVGSGPSSRSAAGADAGMSPRQVKTAMRVANVPADQFEKLVESDNPPTVTKLAEMGKQSQPKPVIDLHGRDPREFNRSMHFIALIKDYAKEIGAADLDLILPGLNEPEAKAVRTAVAAIDAVHDRIVTRI